MQPARTAAPPLTVEDYRATPEGTRYQLVEGDLYLMSPAPNLFHQDIVANLFELMRPHVKKQRLGRVFVAPADVYLSEHDVVQPDILFVSNANLQIIADDGVHGAPDLVVEVLSPRSATLEKTKRRVYARHGVKEYWLVDPTLHQIHVYEFARDPAKAVRILEEEESFGSASLPGLLIAVTDVFQR